MRSLTVKRLGLSRISTSYRSMERLLLKPKIIMPRFAASSTQTRTVYHPQIMHSVYMKLLYTTSHKSISLSCLVGKNSTRLNFALVTKRKIPSSNPKLSCGLSWLVETRPPQKPLNKPSLSTQSQRRTQLLWLLNRLNKPLSICDRLRRKLKTLRAKRMPWNYRYAT